MFFADRVPRDKALMRHAALDRSEGAIFAPTFSLLAAIGDTDQPFGAVELTDFGFDPR